MQGAGHARLDHRQSRRESGRQRRAIRFYERRGLIAQPLKPAEGYRTYDRDTVARVRFIRQAQVLGFSLCEIEELLGLRADPRADCARVRKQAIAKRREVERKIAGLERIRDALDTLIAQCPGSGALAACTILEAIEKASTDPSGRRVSTAEDGPRNGEEEGSDPMKSTTFAVEGMHCDGCTQTIKALVSTEPGVHAADISFNDGRARILYDPQLDHFKTYVWSSVVAYNLVLFTRLQST